jgi:hypothetical protein
VTTGRHVGYESWLERDHLMLLDFDSLVVAVASQPVRLSWTIEPGTVRSPVPDYFARRAEGGGVVADCRPADRIKPRDAVTFAVTRRVCVRVGWRYELAGASGVTVTRNVRGLSGTATPLPPALGGGRAAARFRRASAADGRR